MVLLLRARDPSLNLRARDVLTRCEIVSEVDAGTRYTELRDVHKPLAGLPAHILVSSNFFRRDSSARSSKDIPCSASKTSERIVAQISAFKTSA